jgi:acetyl-CoA synthetase
VFYTAPTAIRALMREGDAPVKKTSRKSLRLLGTVGEPINPEAWEWYHEVVGDERCPIVDTWWQTETGGHMLTPLPGATTLKPGSATCPFFGVVPGIIDTTSNQLITDTEASGALVITRSWPGQMRTVYGDHQRFVDTYFKTYPGYYFSGDGARRDTDGDYWITGRMDDVLNVSGHRMGTAEVESALVLHDAIAEAAVVGYPHDIKGQGIYAYVTPVIGVEPSDELKNELIELVRREIGPIAKPDVIQWAPGLPKTRSGKIMRRILRKIAENDIEHVGDTSTLADPAVVEDLVHNRANK